MKYALVIILVAVLGIAGIVLFIVSQNPQAASSPDGAPVQPDGPTQLPAVEIRQYEGQSLSSVNDFHENSIKGPQYLNITDYRLTVTGLVATPRTYTYNELLDEYPHYSKVVTLFCVEGWDATIFWEGIRVRDIIANAGPDPSVTTVIFRAGDGYSTSLPLDYIVNRDILMAYRMNNITLPAERGYPFELVAEDKWGYKWIRWITAIELTTDSGYRGYWEQRGYSRTGDLDKNFFVD